MTITLELSPDLEAKVIRNAEQNGMRLEDYVRLLIENAPPPPEKSLMETLSPSEFAIALREWSESQPENLPILTEEAMSRQSIYSGDGGLNREEL